MDKPKPELFFSCVDIIDYIKEKYGNTLEKQASEYFYSSYDDICNGALRIFCIADELQYPNNQDNKELLEILQKEFGDEINVNIWW